MNKRLCASVETRLFAFQPVPVFSLLSSLFVDAECEPVSFTPSSLVFILPGSLSLLTFHALYVVSI